MIGRKLFDISVKALEPRNIAVTSREPMTSKYRKGYFPFYGYTIRRQFYKRKLSDTSATEKIQENSEITLEAFKTPMHTQVMSYQNSILKTPEREFNEVFLKVSSHVTAAIKDGAVVGFGALQGRMLRNLYHLSPIYAENGQIASLLINHLLAQVPQEHHVMVCVPEEHQAFINDAFGANGFTLESEAFVDKVYSKSNLEINFEKVFCVSGISKLFIKVLGL